MPPEEPYSNHHPTPHLGIPTLISPILAFGAFLIAISARSLVCRSLPFLFGMEWYEQEAARIPVAMMLMSDMALLITGLLSVTVFRRSLQSRWRMAAFSAFGAVAAYAIAVFASLGGIPL